MQPPKKVDALTGFRALAAGLVFFGHAVRPGPLGAFWWVRYGWSGVNLFFALSGFLFTLLYFDRFTATGLSLRDYFLKRAFRVLPLTWLLVAITVITVGGHSAADVVTHLTLTQAFFARYRFSLNPPMWTLSVEESFYLCVPALFTALGALEKLRSPRSVRGRIAVVCFALALLTLAGHALVTHLAELKQHFCGWWDYNLWPMTFPGHFSDFGCGIGAGLIALRCEESPWLRDRTRATVLFAAGVALWFATSGWMALLGGVDQAGLSKLFPHVSRGHGLAGALMILGLYGRSWLSPLFASRAMDYAGRISFALYLSQYLWVFSHESLMDRVAHALRGRSLPEPVVLGAEYLVVSVVAAALYHAVEVPAQRYLRGRFLREK